MVRRPSRGSRSSGFAVVTLLVVGGLVASLPWASSAAPRDGGGMEPSQSMVEAKPNHKDKRRVSNFTVATFNVLGHRHTAKGGSRASWPGGRKRMRPSLNLLHRYGIDVVGFQELQPEQLKAFNRATGKRWSAYPGARFDRYATHNSIAWNNRHWSLVQKGYLKIPYLQGERVRMPVVKLADNRTGQRVYFANFHNPADTFGNAQKWRNKARKMQIRLARRIHEKGVPLVITGDMNEQDRYFCAMTSRAPMKAANGGGHTRRGTCVPPKPSGIDWIFGSRRIGFWRFYKKPRPEMERISDHPFLATEARLKRR